MLIVTIMSYVIRIKKHLHNQIEIIENRKPMIEIESNRKEYESLHPYHYYWKFSLSLGKRSCIFSKFNLLNVDTPLIWTFFKTPSVSKFIGFNCSNDLLFFNAQPSDYVQMQLRLPTITWVLSWGNSEDHFVFGKQENLRFSSLTRSSIT